MKKKALFVVNPQIDFMPGGSLSVPFGDKIIPVINKIMEKFDFVIALKDDGVEFHPDFRLKDVKIFTKEDGTNSGFSGIDENGTSIEKYLKSKDVDEVYLAGLVGDYGVKETSKDCSVFFKTYFIVDATRFLGDMTPVIEDLAKDGVMIINSRDLDIFLSDDKYFVKR